jgi:hypothetical protein
MGRGALVRVGGVIVAGTLAVAVIAGAAMASRTHPPAGKKGHAAVTKMKFKLNSHSVSVGDQVAGTVHLWTRSNHHWTPLSAAGLSIRLDGTEVDTATSDSDGQASVSVTAGSAGGHVVKVVFVGDDSHRKAHRAQGFEATEPGGPTGPTGATGPTGPTGPTT